MRILIDSNILVSAALNPESVPYQAFVKAVTYPNKAVVCEQNIEEFKRVFERKFPQKVKELRQFLAVIYCVMEVIPIPKQSLSSEGMIRDVSDRPILRAAMKAEVDIIITGDKDFLDAGLQHPIIKTASEFMSMQ